MFLEMNHAFTELLIQNITTFTQQCFDQYEIFHHHYSWLRTTFACVLLIQDGLWICSKSCKQNFEYNLLEILKKTTLHFEGNIYKYKDSETSPKGFTPNWGVVHYISNEPPAKVSKAMWIYSQNVTFSIQESHNFSKFCEKKLVYDTSKQNRTTNSDAYLWIILAGRIEHKCVTEKNLVS